MNATAQTKPTTNLCWRPFKTRVGVFPTLDTAFDDIDDAANWFRKRGIPFKFSGYRRLERERPIVYVEHVPQLDGLGRSLGVTERGAGERFRLDLSGLSLRWVKPLAAEAVCSGGGGGKTPAPSMYQTPAQFMPKPRGLMAWALKLINAVTGEVRHG
jgi:hypothetical protein